MNNIASSEHRRKKAAESVSFPPLKGSIRLTDNSIERGHINSRCSVQYLGKGSQHGLDTSRDITFRIQRQHRVMNAQPEQEPGRIRNTAQIKTDPDPFPVIRCDMPPVRNFSMVEDSLNGLLAARAEVRVRNIEPDP